MYKITFDAGFTCISRVRVSASLETNTGHTIPDLTLREILDSAINEVEMFMTQTAIRFSLDSRVCRPFHKLLKHSCEEGVTLLCLEVSVSKGECFMHPVIRTKEQRQFHDLFKRSASHKLYASFTKRLQLELLQIGIEFSELGRSKVTELEV